MSARQVILDGGSPWGFRINGGCDLGMPIKISRVNPGSKAAVKGVREGDIISSINGTTTKNLNNSTAHKLLRNAGEQLHLSLNEDGLSSPRRKIKQTTALVTSGHSDPFVVRRQVVVRKYENENDSIAKETVEAQVHADENQENKNLKGTVKKKMPKIFKKTKTSMDTKRNTEKDKSKCSNDVQTLIEKNSSPTEKLEKNLVCLPAEKKLKIHNKQQSKKEKKEAFNAIRAISVKEDAVMEPEETQKTVELHFSKNCDTICKPCSIDNTKDNTTINEGSHQNNILPKLRVGNDNEGAMNLEEDDSKLMANYRIEVIPEDLFEEFIDNEELVQVRETVKAHPGMSPKQSPTFKRKHPEKEALVCVTSSPPPKILYNYQGASYLDTFIQVHMMNSNASPNNESQPDMCHNRKLDIIQEESSDFSDGSAHSDAKERPTIRTVITANWRLPHVNVFDEIRKSKELYPLPEEMKEEGITSDSVADEPSVNYSYKILLNKSGTYSDLNEDSSVSVEGHLAEMAFDSENTKTDEDVNATKEGTDFSEKSAWSMKSISSSSNKFIEEESESWRSSVEPEINCGSEADVESELESQKICIFDHYNDFLGVNASDLLPGNHDAVIELFVTNYKYENPICSPKSKTFKNPVEHPLNSLNFEYCPKFNDGDDPSLNHQEWRKVMEEKQRTKEVIAHILCDRSSASFDPDVNIPDLTSDIKHNETVPSHGIIKMLNNDIEKILISKMKVMKSFKDSTTSETSCASLFESRKNQRERKNNENGDSTSISKCMSNASSYENVSRSEKIFSYIQHKVEAKIPQNPEALSNLAEKKILTLPYGKLVLKKIGLGKCCYIESENCKDLEEEVYVKSMPRENDQSFGLSSVPSDVSVQSAPLGIWNRVRPSGDRDPSESRSYIEFDYADSRIGQTEKWYGTPTMVPAVLLGLSPSQKKVFEEKPNRFMADEAEAAGLIDLHKKFIERRSYKENVFDGYKNLVYDSKSNRDSVTVIEIGGPDRISGKLTQSPLENKKSYTLDNEREERIAKGNMQSPSKFGFMPDGPNTRLVGNGKSKTEDNLSTPHLYNKTRDSKRSYLSLDDEKKIELHGQTKDSEVIGNSCLLAILQNATSDNSVPGLNKDYSLKSIRVSHEVPSEQKQESMLSSWQSNPIFGYKGEGKEKTDNFFREAQAQNFERIWNKEKNITSGEKKTDLKNRPKTICCGLESELFKNETITEKKIAPVKNLTVKKRNLDNFGQENSIITEKLPSVSDVIKSFEDPGTHSVTFTDDNMNKKTQQIDNAKYRTYRKNDIAFLQNGEEIRRVRKENRRSLPASLLSDREIFKQKMYNEYMSKLAERIERRQKKVIKVSQCNEFEFPEESKVFDIENEFIKKVRERREKIDPVRCETPIEEQLESLEKKCQEFTNYWQEETINLENGNMDLDVKEKNRDGETESSTSKRSSIQLILDTNSDVDSLPKHLKELLEVDKDDFPDIVDGVWSPNQSISIESTGEKEENQVRKKLEDEPIPPIWTPKSAQASPVLERKEFRPVNFESPILARKKYTQEEKRESSVPPPWQQPGGDKLPEIAKSPSSPALSLPKVPNPTVTLLQKAREGHLPRGAHYLSSKMNDSHSPDQSIIGRVEIVSTTRNESEANFSPKEVIGIGPTTKEGIPLVLRSEVNSENKEKWYKRMYDSLHKAGNDDDYVTVKYRTSPNRRGIYDYQQNSASGYQSEPESLNYDLSSNKYITLDKKRKEQTNERAVADTAVTNTRVLPSRRYFPGYKNQPGRIEDYEPGHSSVSEAEANKWWDEVLEIFDREEEKARPAPQPSRSIKNFASCYISDPQYVYKRAEDGYQSPPSSEEQKEVYKIIQKGGEIPLKGLRKPAPEPPKDDVDTEIEYFPLSPTLTKIRVHKQNITPLSDFPFFLNPTYYEQTTLNIQDLSKGGYSTYSKAQVFSLRPRVQNFNSQLNLIKSFEGSESTQKDHKFSVHLQNISEPNDYVPILTKPRNNLNESPVYANLPLRGRSLSPFLSVIKEEECQKGNIETISSEKSQNLSSINTSVKTGLTTFSDLKRTAPSLVQYSAAKFVKKDILENKSEKQSSIPVLSLRKQKKKNSSCEKETNIIKRKEVLSQCVKSERWHRERLSKNQDLSHCEKINKKLAKNLKVQLSESASREKPLTKTPKRLNTIGVESSIQKQCDTKHLSKKTVELKGNKSIRKKSNLLPNSKLKSNVSKEKPRVVFDVTEGKETKDKMSSTIDGNNGNDSGSKQNTDVDMTEVYRSRSFSPDTRRKIFKLPDMNKPLPPKRKQSKCSPTLKVWSKMKVTYPSHRSRLEGFGSNIKFLQEKIKRKIKDQKEPKVEFGDDVQIVKTMEMSKKDKNGVINITTNKYVSRPLSCGSSYTRATYPDIGRRNLLSECRTRFRSVDELKSLKSDGLITITKIVGSNIQKNSSTIIRSPTSLIKNQVVDTEKAANVSGVVSKGRDTSGKIVTSEKSLSPSSSLRSYRSEHSAKSALSDKPSTSSQEIMRSPQEGHVSSNSSISRFSSLSRSTSPGLTSTKTKIQKASDLKMLIKKSCSTPMPQKASPRVGKSVVKNKEITKIPKITKNSRTNVVKEDVKKDGLKLAEVYTAADGKLKKKVIGKTKMIVNKRKFQEIEKNLPEPINKERNEITAGRDLVRTDSFFQNLFLRNAEQGKPALEMNRNSSVLERAQMFQRRINWPETYKSEPALPLVHLYLHQKRPVSFSRFRNFDRDCGIPKSRSPLGSLHSENFQVKLVKFDSLTQFGDVLPRDFSPDGKERSSSEPPLHRSTNYSPDEGVDEKRSRVSQSEASSIRSSSNSSHSPSYRRVKSYRSTSKPLEYCRVIRKITHRARSAGEVDEIKSKSNLHGELAESTSSLNLSNFSDLVESQSRNMQLMHSRRKCERFRELYKFYSNLEKMEKLEKTASTGDLRPRLRNEEIIDFDRWKKVRTKERAEAQLKALVDNLMKEQKEKDLLFRAADIDAVRWKGDRGLRIKEQSVEDLKEQFNKYSQKSDVDWQKSSWKSNSAMDVSSTFNTGALVSHKTRPNYDDDSQNARTEKEYRYSNKAWSSLSNEQVNFLKDQLNEIYTQEAYRKRLSEELLEKYDIFVPDDKRIKSPGESSLQVRCNSAMSKSQTFTPNVKHKETIQKEWKKADSISVLPPFQSNDEVSSIPECTKIFRSHSGETSHSRQEEYFPITRSKSESFKPIPEEEKKRLSMTLSREVVEKMTKGLGKAHVLPRETLGALAVAGGKLKDSSSSKPSGDDFFYLTETSKDRDDKFMYEWKGNSRAPAKATGIPELESGSGSSETSVKTVIRKNSVDVLKKVQYFEDLQQTPQCSVEGEWKDEFNVNETSGEFERKKVFFNSDNEKIDNAEGKVTKKDVSKTIHKQSSSFENINEYFGHKKEHMSSSRANKSTQKLISTEISRTFIPHKTKNEDVISDENKWIPVRYDSTSPIEFKRISRNESNESLFSYRSRSVSPDPTKYYRAYLRMVKCGAVRRLCNKFESWEDLLSLSSDKDFWLPPAPRRFASDPELTRDLLKRFGTDPTKVTIRGQEVGDVRWLRTKFEKDLFNNRGRSRIRRVRSPLVRSPITSSDRFMPRINVISKKAELQLQGLTPELGKLRVSSSSTRTNEILASPEGYSSLIDYKKDHGGYYFTGEVEKLRRKFERLQEAERLSILGQMYTSTPDVSELRDIAPYLECAWVAHRHPGHSKSPEPKPEKRDASQKIRPKPRPRSSSPIRLKQPLSILKQSHPTNRSIFADQKFDPFIHRPIYRYRPEREVDRRYRRGDPDCWRHWNKPTVTFKESPRKYVESEVTIHYKSPVRAEAKAMLSEDELARRQAESMKRIYKEERRRKYLQELQDLNSRRHTDNFIPSQKSPIPLNRYDDFPLDCNLYNVKGKDYTLDPVLVARGLYDFVGKRPRELAFRRGDIIFIMRRLDKNWCEGELNGAVGIFPLSYVEIIPYNEISTKFGRARAKYDFVAQTHLELSARKGDMIILMRKIDENWFEGRIGERTGIIPASYCHIMAMPQASKSALRSEKVNKPVAAPAAHSLIHDGSSLSSKHYYAPHLSSVTSPGRSTVHSTTADYQDRHLTADMLIDEALMQLDEEFDLKRTNSKHTSVNVRVNPRPEPTLYQVLFNHVPNNDDELELIQGETVTVVEKCGDGWYIGSKTNDGKLGIFPGTHVRRITPEFV